MTRDFVREAEHLLYRAVTDSVCGRPAGPSRAEARWPVVGEAEASSRSGRRVEAAKSSATTGRRKVIVGTTMTRWYGDYPASMGGSSRSADWSIRWRRNRVEVRPVPRPALFTEYAVTAGKQAPPLRPPSRSMRGSSRPWVPRRASTTCYIVFGGVFLDDPATASLLERRRRDRPPGPPAGRYAKVHPVLDRVGPDGQIVLEGGVRPGTEYNVLDLDFGRVGVQICYDVEYSEGWRRWLKGAELVLYPTQSPQLTRPAMYAATPRILGCLLHVPEQCVVLRARDGARRRPDHGAEADPRPRDRPQLPHPPLVVAATKRRGLPQGVRGPRRLSLLRVRRPWRLLVQRPGPSIGEMARYLGLPETPAEQQARAAMRRIASEAAPRGEGKGASIGLGFAEAGSSPSQGPTRRTALTP